MRSEISYVRMFLKKLETVVEIFQYLWHIKYHLNEFNVTFKILSFVKSEKTVAHIKTMQICSLNIKLLSISSERCKTNANEIVAFLLEIPHKFLSGVSKV